MAEEEEGLLLTPFEKARNTRGWVVGMMDAWSKGRGRAVQLSQ